MPPKTKRQAAGLRSYRKRKDRGDGDGVESKRKALSARKDSLMSTTNVREDVAISESEFLGGDDTTQADPGIQVNNPNQLLEDQNQLKSIPHLKKSTLWLLHQYRSGLKTFHETTCNMLVYYSTPTFQRGLVFRRPTLLLLLPSFYRRVSVQLDDGLMTLCKMMGHSLTCSRVTTLGTTP